MPVSPPTLENRSLRISPTIPGFEYQYEVCDKTNIFGNCKASHWQIDKYDLSDPVTRQKFIDMGFIGVVRGKLK